jgi:hypothetical protein
MVERYMHLGDETLAAAMATLDALVSGTAARRIAETDLSVAEGEDQLQAGEIAH